MSLWIVKYIKTINIVFLAIDKEVKT